MFLIEQYMFYSDSINTGNHNLHDSHTPSEIFFYPSSFIKITKRSIISTAY